MDSFFTLWKKFYHHCFIWYDNISQK